ncbi:putative MFS drug efflux transporter [Xylaria sp. FL0043]|nr:putative MFS drug efflux transporter [Xylaria sp. FL0043]
MDHDTTTTTSKTPPNEALFGSETEKDQQAAPSGASSPTNEPAPLPPRNVSGIGWVLVVSSILSTIFLFALDNTVTANVQPSIVGAFHRVDLLPWVSVAYLLGSAAVNLFWGQIYTSFNAKWTYLVCVTVFEAGSALCGGAPNMNAFIVGRVLCGLFGAGMYVGVITLLALTTHDHERAAYFGLVGITWGFGTVLGPIIGGALADAQAWRFAFYLNLFVGALFAPVYLFLIPNKDPRPGASLKARVSVLDFLGTVLLAGAMVTLLMAISFGGTVYAWNSAKIIALFVVFGVLTILFVLQQVFTVFTTVETRLFPLHFLKMPIMLSQAAVVAASATASFTIIYFIPLFYQLVKNEDALISGVHLLPYVAFMVTICVGNGILLGKFGHYAPWTLFSGVFIVIGSALLLTVTSQTSPANVYGYAILYGLGVGATIQMPFSIASAKVKPEEGGLAIGYCTFFQFTGPAVALSVANSVFLNESLVQLASYFPGLAKNTILGALFGLNPALLAGSADVPRSTIEHILVSTLSRIWAIPLSSGALILVLSLTMKWEKLFGEGNAPAAVGAA